MNNKTEDQILNDLMRKKNELPPKALDDLILNAAQKSLEQKTNDNVTEKSHNWRPWLAAASIVLVMPLVWMITQNKELTQVTAPMPAPQVTTKSTQSLDEAAEETQDSALSDYDEQDEYLDQGKITVTGSRMRATPAAEEPHAAPADYMAEFEEEVIKESKLSITGKPIDQESLATNKAVLKNELKAKKRTVKPSNMDPLMALEYAQFGRYLEEGQFDLADELLTEMQENWPDFDFEDMIYRLAAAEAGSG